MRLRHAKTRKNDLVLVEHAAGFGERSRDRTGEENRLARFIDVREGAEGSVVGPGWDGHGRSIEGNANRRVYRTAVGNLEDSRFHGRYLRSPVEDVVAVEAGIESGCGLRLELDFEIAQVTPVGLANVYLRLALGWEFGSQFGSTYKPPKVGRAVEGPRFSCKPQLLSDTGIQCADAMSKKGAYHSFTIDYTCSRFQSNTSALTQTRPFHRSEAARHIASNR